MGLSFLHWGCCLEPAAQPKLPHRLTELPKDKELRAAGQMALTSLSYYLITLIHVCSNKLGDSLASLP